MKKILIVFLLGLLLISSTSLAFAEDTKYLSGTLMTVNKEKYEVKRFLYYEEGGDEYTFYSFNFDYSKTRNGDVREIEMSKIKEYTRLEKRDERWAILIKTREGNEGEFFTREKSYNEIKIEYYDEFTNNVKTKVIELENIKRIVFNDTLGNMKINKETGDIFPPSYIFDPYTGEELVLYDTDKKE